MNNRLTYYLKLINKWLKNLDKFEFEKLVRQCEQFVFLLWFVKYL